MSLVLNLPTKLESELADMAARDGLSLADYIVRILSEARTTLATPARTGAEVVTYWQSEGLIGTRPDIVDASTHARNLREQAQRRAR